jgi:hypothetical protein
MKVLPIKTEEAVPWIMQKHYAKRLPSISYAFGLYVEAELMGIVTYGIPASNSLCEGVCGVENKSLVIELNRLCLQNNTKNEASFLVANSIKLLPKPMVIVSYADTAHGHVGYVYQATNFMFTGTTKERTDMSAGEGKHSRHATDPSIRQFRSAKHRYVFIHGNKTQKKILLGALNYKQEPYPKGDIKKYDSGGKVVTQSLLFVD